MAQHEYPGFGMQYQPEHAEVRIKVTQLAVDWAVLPARGIKKAAAQMGNLPLPYMADTNPHPYGVRLAARGTLPRPKNSPERTPEGTRLHFSFPRWKEKLR